MTDSMGHPSTIQRSSVASNSQTHNVNVENNGALAPLTPLLFVADFLSTEGLL
jgi:hypothetical protein